MSFQSKRRLLFVDVQAQNYSLAARIQENGFEVVFADPTNQLCLSPGKYTMHVLIYDPFLGCPPYGERFRTQFLDEVLERAKRDKIPRIAYTIHPERTINERGFVQGREYDVLISKMGDGKNILHFLKQLPSLT